MDAQLVLQSPRSTIGIRGTHDPRLHRTPGHVVRRQPASRQPDHSRSTVLDERSVRRPASGLKPLRRIVTQQLALEVPRDCVRLENDKDMLHSRLDCVCLHGGWRLSATAPPASLRWPPRAPASRQLSHSTFERRGHVQRLSVPLGGGGIGTDGDAGRGQSVPRSARSGARCQRAAGGTAGSGASSGCRNRNCPAEAATVAAGSAAAGLPADVSAEMSGVAVAGSRAGRVSGATCTVTWKRSPGLPGSSLPANALSATSPSASARRSGRRAGRGRAAPPGRAARLPRHRRAPR